MTGIKFPKICYKIINFQKNRQKNASFSTKKTRRRQCPSKCQVRPPLPLSITPNSKLFEVSESAPPIRIEWVCKRLTKNYGEIEIWARNTFSTIRSYLNCFKICTHKKKSKANNYIEMYK